jgi:hypothetical protein
VSHVELTSRIGFCLVHFFPCCSPSGIQIT